MTLAELDTEGLNEGSSQILSNNIFWTENWNTTSSWGGYHLHLSNVSRNSFQFDARNDEKLDEAIFSPYNTQLLSRQQPSLRVSIYGITGVIALPPLLIPLILPATLMIIKQKWLFQITTLIITLVYKTLMVHLFRLGKGAGVSISHHSYHHPGGTEDVRIDLQILQSWETKINNFRGQAEVCGFYTSVLQDPLQIINPSYL